MVQIKCLSNGLYSLKNSHIPFGQGFQPRPLTDKDRLNRAFLVQGLPLLNFFLVCFDDWSYILCLAICLRSKSGLWTKTITDEKTNV